MVKQDRSELGVVENLLEDGFVRVHSGDDGVHKPAVEHESEVFQVVVSSLGGKGIIIEPFPLIDQRAIGLRRLGQ